LFVDKYTFPDVAAKILEPLITIDFIFNPSLLTRFQAVPLFVDSHTPLGAPANTFAPLVAMVETLPSAKDVPGLVQVVPLSVDK